MTRRLDLTFSALLIPLDFMALLGAVLTAYALRHSQFFVTTIRPILQYIKLTDHLGAVISLIVISLLIFALAGLYSIRPRRLWNEFGRIIVASTASMMVVIATVFFRREVTTSRFLVLATWVIAIVYVCLGRAILRLLRRMILKRGIGHHRLVIIGQGQPAKDLVNVYQNSPVLGFTLIKQYKTWNAETRSQLTKLVKQQAIDTLLLADTELTKAQARDLIAFCEDNHLTFRYIADVFAASFANIEVSTAEGIPIIESKRTPLDGWGRIAKRIFDIIFALLILILTSPLTLAAMLIRLLEDGTPIIFKNTRVGERGQLFHLFKIRSMWRKYCIGPQFKEREAENRKLLEKITREYSLDDGPVKRINEQDPRITPLGRFIRRWSIDELPQMWNVLRGEMSIIGPRPHEPEEVAHYTAEHRRVLAIKPGITGMGQISGRRNLSFNDEARLDNWYIEHWSLTLDFYILLKTPWVVLSKKGVY